MLYESPSAGYQFSLNSLQGVCIRNLGILQEIQIYLFTATIRALLYRLSSRDRVVAVAISTADNVKTAG
ncbi:MAG: hypothetical protein EBU88_13000 [Acidobacteria bacterium]|nr:hypothetical protein [Acidobacteriota bacterium]